MSTPKDASALLNGHETDSTPDPNPWRTLADRARALAALADHLGTLPPDHLAPFGPDSEPTAEGPTVPVDWLGVISARAAAIVTDAAACRTHTWAELARDGLKHRDIGALWGKTRNAITVALNRIHRTPIR